MFNCGLTNKDPTTAHHMNVSKIGKVRFNAGSFLLL